MTEALSNAIVSGGYWLKPPAPKTDIVIAYTGVVAPEAIAAADQLNAQGIATAVLAVTSAGRLHSGWTHTAHMQRRSKTSDASHVENLLTAVPCDCAILTVLDGHPAALAWLGSVRGHRASALGVEKFGESGSISDLYAIQGIDAASIIEAGQALATPRPSQRAKRQAS